MKLRLFQPADLLCIIELYSSAIRGLAAHYYSPEQITAWASMPPDALRRWQERLANHQTIIAETDAIVAGFASFTPEGYLDFLFTHPEFARHGVASTLYRIGESTLIAAGVRIVSAHVSLAAREFFEHHGFHVDAEEETECRGVCLRRFSMYKDLAKRWAPNQDGAANRSQPIRAEINRTSVPAGSGS